MRVSGRCRIGGRGSGERHAGIRSADDIGIDAGTGGSDIVSRVASEAVKGWCTDGRVQAADRAARGLLQC